MRIFLACTPRTGNLWMRRVLIHALGLPQYVGHNPDAIDWDGLPENCLVAMHWRRTDAFAGFLRARGFTTIVSARHPLDVLISVLRFSQLEATGRWLEGEGGDESGIAGVDPTSTAFAEYCLGPRANALLSVSPEWHRDAVATIRYEDFLASPSAAARAALRALGASAVRPIDEAITHNSVDMLRSMAATHVWRGQSGDWRRVVTASLARRIAARYSEYFREFGYACDPDLFLDSRTARLNWDLMLAGANSDDLVRASAHGESTVATESIAS